MVSGVCSVATHELQYQGMSLALIKGRRKGKGTGATQTGARTADIIHMYRAREGRGEIWAEGAPRRKIGEGANHHSIACLDTYTIYTGSSFEGSSAEQGSVLRQWKNVLLFPRAILVALRPRKMVSLIELSQGRERGSNGRMVLI